MRTRRRLGGSFGRGSRVGSFLTASLSAGVTLTDTNARLMRGGPEASGNHGGRNAGHGELY
jgi:hypothetical protein